jgi:hypothetical protein
MMKPDGGKPPRPWSPDLKLVALKELVSAILGLLVVGSTVVLTFQAFLFAGNPSKMSDARDLLTLMLGVSGVVLGYYFGRVPSDARAAQAQQQTQEATTAMEHMGGHNREMARKMDAMASEIVAGHPVDARVAQQLRDMADQMRYTAG